MINSHFCLFSVKDIHIDNLLDQFYDSEIKGLEKAEDEEDVIANSAIN